MALLQLFVFEAGDTVDERAYELIGNFGVALLSTVAGILARILLHSGVSQNVPVHPEEGIGFLEGPRLTGSVIQEENEALRRDLAGLRSALREATDAFSHFNRVTTVQSEEAIVHTASVMRKFNEEMVSAVSVQLDQATVTLQTATETLRSQSDELTRHFEGVVADFNSTLSSNARQSIEETGVAWRNAAKEMRGDNKKQIELFCEDIKKLVSVTEGAWNEMQVLSNHVGATGHEMNTHATELRKMAQDTEDARRGITKFVEHIEKAQSRLHATADAADNAARSAANSAGEIARINSSLTSDLKRVSEEALKDHKASTKEMTNLTLEQLETDREEWLQNANSTNAEIERQREANLDTLKQAQHLTQQLSEEATQWGKLAEHTRRALVDTIDTLTERVGKG